MPPTLITANAIRTAKGLLGDALVVENGRIKSVGRAESFRADGLFEQPYGGATIVPGLWDAHLHPLGHAATLASPSLKQATDFADLADRIGEALGRLPAGSALLGLRLDDEALAEQRLPDREFIDRISGDTPAVLLRYCGHIAVANTAALELAGIDASSPDPAGGSIDRDAEGRPTGVLRETAMTPVMETLLPLAPPTGVEQLIAASYGLAAAGLTSIGAMAWTDNGPWSGGNSEVDRIIAAAHRLAVTARVMVVADNPTDLEKAATRLGSAGGRVSFAGAKMFSDGSLGGHTAAMHHGFADKNHETGTDRLDPEWAYGMANASLRLGGLVAIHAIGDRANTNVLDLMERLIADGADPSRLRIEHASVLTESDIARFGSLGVTASVQPAFIASETGWLEKRVGPERLARTYPFRSLLDAGASLAGGSDSPVEPPHPLWGMAAARDRCGIVPGEAVTAEEALAMFTSGAATSMGAVAGLGVGDAATFTVLDTDPVAASPNGLRATRVLDTWIDGERIDVPDGTVIWNEELVA